MRSKEAPPAEEIERLQEALGDRWALERELGHGLTSTVYLARDLKHHRRVAVKVLRPELAASIGRERFHREIEIASSLSHPHILPLYSSGEANGQLYYVMPYVGESLEDRMTREGPLPLGETLRIAREVAAALAYAHQHGVVHRDIKPANVMLSAGEAVVADFGIAKAITDAGHEKLTQTGIAIGSPVYMSPEQATGERELDGRSDIYSLGCVVYEMLTGEPPVMGNTPTEVLSHRLMDDVLPLTSHVKGVPPEVEEVIKTALARDRHDRYPSAEAFAAALESTGSTLPGPALSAAPKRKKAFWTELQRRKVYSTAILYAVVAWVTVEVTDTTFPHLGLEAAVPAIVLLAVIGLPVALGLAWAFEVSREGIRRTQPVAVAPANRTSLWVSGVAILALFVVIGAGIRVSSAWRAGTGSSADPQGADTPPTYAAGSLAPGAGEPNATRPRPTPTHIAVLPFEDVSADGELGHLGSAFARTLIDDLTQVKALTVVSFNGVRPFRHSTLPVDSIGVALAVGTLVTGAVDESEGQLRVTVSLVDAATSMNLASWTLDRPRGEAFQLQDALAFEVAGFLRESLGEEVRLRERRAATTATEAWELVQQAEHLREDVQPLFKAGDREEASAMLIRIDAILDRAESFDPGWVEPIVLRGWLAAKQASLAAEEPGMWDEAWMEDGITHAERALDLRPDDAKALELRGSLRYRLWYATEDSRLSELLAGAERDLRTAVALDPTRARAWSYLSILLNQAKAEFAESRTAAQRAYEADPFLEEASDILKGLAQAYLDLGELEKASRWAAEGRRRFPDNVDFVATELGILTLASPEAGNVEQAWALTDTTVALSPPTRLHENVPIAQMQVAIVIGRAGLADSARSVIERTRLQAGEEARVISAYEEAAAWLSIGETEASLEALSLFVDAYPLESTYLASDAWFEALWDDPRFQELVSTPG